MRATIDINADLGEGFPWDNTLLDMITSASISCGAHAGDDPGICESLTQARQRGVVIGAHPSYPDRVNFGRRDWNPEISSSEIYEMVSDQLGHMADLGAALRFVKPHGAFYNQAQKVESIAQGLVDAVYPWGLPILGLAGSCVDRACRHAGLSFIAEGFADRRYRDSGELVPRSEPNAVLDDPTEIAAQVLVLARRGIGTICLHGDNPHSVVIGALVRFTLTEAGVAIRPFVIL